MGARLRAMGFDFSEIQALTEVRSQALRIDADMDDESATRLPGSSDIGYLLTDLPRRMPVEPIHRGGTYALYRVAP